LAVSHPRPSHLLGKHDLSIQQAGVSFTMIKMISGEQSEPPRQHMSSPSNSNLTPLSLPCSPDLTYLRQASLRPLRRRSPPSMKTTSNRQRSTEHLTVTADPRVVNCFRSSHQQLIHTLRAMLTAIRKDAVRLRRTTARPKETCNSPAPSPNQYILTTQVHLWLGLHKTRPPPKQSILNTV
jgi:hypothetical protein